MPKIVQVMRIGDGSLVNTKMHVFVPGDYYERMLDNTLVHIYNESCGFTMSMCMACENEIKPLSMLTKLETHRRTNTYPSMSTPTYENFVFVMCARCRKDVQSKMGMIPDRSKQRSMIENIIMERRTHGSTGLSSCMNPNVYLNIYVLSVENGVEVILLVGKTDTTKIV
jgi:hypothetical protein